MAIQTDLSLLSGSFSLRSFSQAKSAAASNPAQPATALSSLQDKALQSIAREVPGMSVSGLKALDPAEYTPEKVAGRIGAFVEMGLESAKARGKSDEDIQALYESAVKGVEKGFAEAKEILSRLNVLNGAIAEQVDATEKATFDVLGGLDPSRTRDSGSVSRVLSMAERYQRAEDFELSLKTREGDLVTVSFSRDLDARAGLALAEDGSGRFGAVMDVSRSERSGYRFSVEGDLSTAEIDAIQSLVQDVGQVANDFFSGDVQKAFEQVGSVSFDTSQLASMKLHMSRVEQYSMAQRYQETQRIGDPEAESAGRRLGHLMQDFRESFEKPALEFMNEPDTLASRLMEALVEQDARFKNADTEGQSRYRGNLGGLLSGVTDRD